MYGDRQPSIFSLMAKLLAVKSHPKSKDVQLLGYCM